MRWYDYLIIVVIAILFIFAIIYMVKHPCSSCDGCAKKDQCQKKKRGDDK